MHTTVRQLYRKIDADREYCFNVEATRPLTAAESRSLRLVLADGILAATVSDSPYLAGERVVEVGPRLNFATAW
ncbi:MAG TPA: hypothetical protein ENG79_06360, partial [Desulfobacteraceae bacterium]|nr:hypothetical protein [Desulfobacteraceae bacterium]